MALAAFHLTGCERERTGGAAGHFPDKDLTKPNAANEGVVLAWRSTTTPVADKVNTISVGDTVVVRVRNLDGWLIRKLEGGRLTGEPSMSPDQKKNYLYYTRIYGSFGNKECELALFRHNVDAGGDLPVKIPPGLSGTDLTSRDLLSARITYQDLLDARIAYNTLLNTVRRGLFLVLNNGQFRNIKAENPDALNLTNSQVVKEKEVTLHELEFRLRRLPGDEEAWATLYDGTAAIHNVRVGVAVELDKNVYVLDSAVFPEAQARVQRVQLELFQRVWLLSVLAGLLALLWGGIYLSMGTSLIRDMDLPLRADGCPQFSLSRLQLAFWTYLTVAAFLTIWLVTDRLDTLNATVLVLLGISSGTTIASKLVNTLTLDGGSIPLDPERAARRHKPAALLRKELEEELRQLEAKANELEAKPDFNGGDANYKQLCARGQRLRDDLDYLNGNRFTRFCVDLLAENGSVTIHRLQVVVWTVVLGVVFIARVRRELSMPVFSETLLGLMGLSSATYIALKVPELKSAQSDVNESTK